MKATVILSLLLLSSFLLCNQMDQICMMQEGQPWDDFGSGIAALDFNGDGYDDLAVLQMFWVPDSLLSLLPTINYGRLLFYYGGQQFDNTPDFTISGTYPGELCTSQFYSYLVSVGDVNGDGCDDLGVVGNTDWTGGSSSNQRPYVAVYFGGQNPSSQPGYYKWFPSPHSSNQAEIDPLGDINNDGFDDFGYCYKPDNYYNELSEAAIILGNNQSFTEVVWRRFTNQSYSCLNPVGDVNHDGYDDYVFHYWNAENTEAFKTNTLYFGRAEIMPVDSLLLYSGNDIMAVKAKGLGDLNGDGKDDFCGFMRSQYLRVWFGNETLSSLSDLNLSPGWSGESSSDRGLIHGDLNHDGYDDAIGSSPLSNGQSGGFRIWLGGTNMNGTSDLTVNGPYIGMQMGIGMAAGDFNADGYCDVAASAPHSTAFDSSHGRVYVYAGNAQLTDTTISNEENAVGNLGDRWSFRIIPNPVFSGQSWKLKFTGRGYAKLHKPVIRIYNAKGQKVKTFSISSEHIQSGEFDISDLRVGRGIYEVSLYEKGNLLHTGKITIK